MQCPNCYSTNVSVSMKQPRIVIKRPHYGILWWLLLGWVYLLYLLFVCLFKLVYWLLIGWWVSLIRAAKRRIDARTRVCVCQNCGYHWELR